MGPGQPLTEHGVQAHEAADEAIKINVHVLVGVAHGDDVVELVVQPKPCRETKTGTAGPRAGKALLHEGWATGAPLAQPRLRLERPAATAKQNQVKP